MHDDAQLLRRYTEEGSEDAFAEFVRRHLVLVYGAALRRLCGDAAGAADVAQRVFVAAARHARRLSRHGSVTGWLYTTTRNAALDHMRDEQRRRRREREAHELAALDAPSGEIGERLRPELDRSLDDLSAADREAVLLRFFEGHSFAEVGRRLRLTENAARMRVERALERLREKLARRGVTSTAAALGLVLSGEACAAVPGGLAASVAAAAFAGGAKSAGGGLTLGVFLTTMSTTKVTVGIAVLVALACLGTAVFEARQHRAAEAALAALRHEREDLQARLAEADKRASASQSATALPKPPRQPVANSGTALEAKEAGDSRPAATASASDSSGGKAGTSLLDRLILYPEYQDVAMRQQRAGLPLKFGPLYRKLGLTEAQIAAFESALMESQRTSFDAAEMAVAQGIASSDPALNVLRESNNKLFGDRLKAALGIEGFKEFNQYLKTVDARTPVDALAGNLYYTEAPLTPTQAERLTALIAANTSQPPLTGLFGGRKTVNWEAILPQTDGLLTASQRKTLELLNQKARLDQEISDVSGRLLKGAPKR